MFTGIIEDLGTVIGSLDGKITVSSSLSGFEKGESIAVDGVCLTVTGISASGASSFLTFDVSPETYKRSALGGIKKGGRVNIERSLKLGNRLGGHFVTGHIDGLGKIESVLRQNGFELWEFSCPENLMKYVAEKGSVAVDGISLTVAGRKRNSFTAAVIPFTLKNTTLMLKKKGLPVNIETDVLAKYVETVSTQKGVTLEGLKKAGFL